MLSGIMMNKLFLCILSLLVLLSACGKNSVGEALRIDINGASSYQHYQPNNEDLVLLDL